MMILLRLIHFWKKVLKWLFHSAWKEVVWPQKFWKSMLRLQLGHVLKIASQSLQLKGFNFLPITWIFKIFVRLSQIHDLCIFRWKNLIFSEGQPRKMDFLIFLASSILLEAMKKKLATSSFPRYFYANLPDVDSYSNLIAKGCLLPKFIF